MEERVTEEERDLDGVGAEGKGGKFPGSKLSLGKGQSSSYDFLLFCFLLSLVLGRGNRWMRQVKQAGGEQLHSSLLVKAKFLFLKKKRCLESPKKLELPIRCAEGMVHTIESPVFGANKLMDFSNPLQTGVRGPWQTQQNSKS